MIVTSQTCFLNVITQFYDKNTLVNATYYIADLVGPGGVNMDPMGDVPMDGRMGATSSIGTVSYKYEDGQLVKTEPPVAVDSLQSYHVHYCRGALNPTSLMTSQRIGPEKFTGKLTPEQRFIESLKNSDSAAEIYDDLFYHKPRGNGLQILIYTNEKICCQFGWITCEYLSSCFGADIIFPDAQYRKKIAPQSKVNYKGNKEYAAKFISQVRDNELIEGFRVALTKSNLRECMNNVTAKLNVMDWAGLIHLYNLLWPEDPLPPGNYATDQLKEIIMSKVLGSRRPTPFDAMDNLYAADAFDEMIAEYDE